jgi:hypothetical protein
MTELARIDEPPRAVTVQSTRDTVDGWLPMFEPVAKLAVDIAQTEFVPQGLRGKPAAITAAILYGREIGLGPIQSLQSVDVIDGRPAISAEMARALALAAGHELFVEESTTQRCVVRGRRVNSREWVQITWTMDDAKRAGLDGRQNWRKHPRRMLQARATSELCHLLFSDAIGGMPFTLEEIADDSDAAGAIGAGAEQAGGRTAQRSRRQRPTPVPTPATDDGGAPPLPGDEPSEEPAAAQQPATDQVEPVTGAQVTKLQTTYGALGIKSRDDKLMVARKIIGRDDLATSKELTKEEASVIIDTLERVADAPDPKERLAAIFDATDAADAQAAAGGDQGTLPLEGGGK